MFKPAKGEDKCGLPTWCRFKHLFWIPRTHTSTLWLSRIQISICFGSQGATPAHFGFQENTRVFVLDIKDAHYHIKFPREQTSSCFGFQGHKPAQFSTEKNKLTFVLDQKDAHQHILALRRTNWQLFWILRTHTSQLWLQKENN